MNLTVCVGIKLYTNCALWSVSVNLAIYYIWLLFINCIHVFFISSHEMSVKESSPQNHQRRAQDNIDPQVQENDDRQLNQEYPVNALVLVMQGQDPPKLAVGDKDYGKCGRLSPLGPKGKP